MAKSKSKVGALALSLLFMPLSSHAVTTYYAYTFEVEPRDVKSGNPALFKAVLADDVERVRQLLDEGADPNDVYTFQDPDFCGERTRKRYSVPLTAAKSLAVVKLLVEHGASVNTEGWDTYVPLVEAVRWGRVDIVRYLLEQPGINIYKSEWRYLSYDEIEERENEGKSSSLPVSMDAFRAVYASCAGPTIGQSDDKTQKIMKQLLLEARDRNPVKEPISWF